MKIVAILLLIGLLTIQTSAEEKEQEATDHQQEESGQVSILEWIAAKGAQVDKLQISHPDKSRKINPFSTASQTHAGLFLKSDVKAGDVIATFPIESTFHTKGLNVSTAVEHAKSQNEEFHEFLSAVCSGFVHINPELLEKLKDEPEARAAWDQEQAAVATVLTGPPLLAFRMLFELTQAKESDWAAWVLALGRIPPGVAFWTEDKLAELQIPAESPLLNARMQQIQLIKQLYAGFQVIVDGNEAAEKALAPVSAFFTEAWFLWAYGTVVSMVVEVAEDAVAIIPGLQHANHANPGFQNTDLRVNKKTLQIEMVAKEDLAHNQELLFSFSSFSMFSFGGEKPEVKQTENNSQENADHDNNSGSDVAVDEEDGNEKDNNENDSNDKDEDTVTLSVAAGFSNTQLLLNYGLSLAINEFENVGLNVGLMDAADLPPPNSPPPSANPFSASPPSFEQMNAELMQILKLQRHVLEHNHLPTECLVSLSGVVPVHFIHALRVKQLTMQDLGYLGQLDYKFHPEDGYLSVQNELMVHLSLVENIEQLLDQYPTTLEQDLLIIEQSQLDFEHQRKQNTLLAVLYRASIKRVLHMVILRSLQSIRLMFQDLVGEWTIKEKQLSSALSTDNNKVNDNSHDSDNSNNNHNNDDDQAEVVFDSSSSSSSSSSRQDKKSEELNSWRSQTAIWSNEADEWDGQWHNWVQKIIGSKGIDILLYPDSHPDQAAFL